MGNLNNNDIQKFMSDDHDYQTRIRKKDIRRDKFRREHDEELKEKEDARLSRTKRGDSLLPEEP